MTMTTLKHSADSGFEGFEEEFIRDALEELVSLPPGTPVAVDTETRDGLSVADNTAKVIGISLAWSGCSLYCAVAHESGGNVSSDTVSLLHRSLVGKRLIFANVQFDLIGLLHLGIDLREEDFYDVPTMAALVDENRPRQRSLDALGEHYCNSKKVSDPFVEKEKRSGNHFITPEQMWDYACVDAELTYRVYDKIVKTEEWQRLQNETDVWPMKQRLIRVLIVMRLRGIRVDVELTKELEELGLKRQDELREAMEFNPGSHSDNERIFIQHLNFPVLKKSKTTGKPSFDKEVMEVYDRLLERTDNPLAKQVKEYRGWNKATSACYTPYLRLLGQDGRLHASFNTHRTVTGRLSSSEPNLQQVPKETDKPWNGRVKECFVADPGYVLLSFDYSQLELRLGAAYAQEQSLLDVFNNHDRDIFTEMAGELGLTRPDTKTFVYATNYGAGDRKIATNLGVSVNTAKEIRANYKASYPGLARIDAFCQRRVNTDGFITLWTGRRRRFQYKSESYKAMNSLIQGGAADIVERVMIRVWDEIDNEEECRMLLQVHDALVFEVKEELAEEYTERILSVMQDVNGIIPEHIDGTFDIHFKVEASKWAEAA